MRARLAADRKYFLSSIAGIVSRKFWGLDLKEGTEGARLKIQNPKRPRNNPSYTTKVNKDKTEALALGNSGSLWEGHLDMIDLCDVINILGVYFGGDTQKKKRTELLEDSGIKKTINLWKWRGLSLIGRIQTVKTFATPKLMFRPSAISISKDLVKEVDSIFYHFI